MKKFLLFLFVLLSFSIFAEKITTDDLSQRIVEPKSDDELKTLTQIINQMLDRLENSFDNQSKFVSDASHELRTPLAIIKGYAEIIKKRRFADEEIFEESIDSIINETENMKNLVQKLLFLAKGEISKINTNFQIIEMKEFVQQIHTDTEVSSKSHKFYLEKNEELKSLSLQETPWTLTAKKETEQKNIKLKPISHFYNRQ